MEISETGKELFEPRSTLDRVGTKPQRPKALNSVTAAVHTCRFPLEICVPRIGPSTELVDLVLAKRTMCSREGHATCQSAREEA